MEIRYALVKELPGMEYDVAVERTTELLVEEGFGVLTEIDVKATLKKKLDLDFKRYVILGACNPELAHEALSGEPILGVLLPCNHGSSTTTTSHQTDTNPMTEYS